MENTKRCITCGYDAKPDAKFCLRCGGNQFYAPTVRCPVCGAQVPQSQYCAHCGADLQNPSAQVWRNCGNCGNAVHISYTHCTCCGAPNLPPVQPKPVKKRSNAWLALLLIPVVLMLVGGICVAVLEFLDNGFPQLNAPHTTAAQKDPTTPSFHRPTQPHIPHPTTVPSESMPGAVPTEPQPTVIPTRPTTPQPTEPTQPEPTEPEPTEPKPTEPSNNIPTIFRDNHYLSTMGNGYCETMTGKMVVLFVFVNDPTDGWTDEERAEAEPALLDALRTLLSEAEAYGAELEIGYVFQAATIGTEFDRDSKAWKKEAMQQLGMQDGYQDQRKLEEMYDVDNVPVVFLVDEPGRSYANFMLSGNGFESVTICQKDYAALRHEMCHLFGARDMYFPQETVAAAKQYLPNGIMYGDCEGNVDALTAFVIGWTKDLTDEAVSFLWTTNSLTEEYIEAAKEQDQLTGYGTKYFDGGHYTGYMVGGVYHGEGTCYWDDGYIFTGTWVNGIREGYGEITGPDGYVYKGYWQNNAQHGTGTVTYVGGDTYSGDFVNGQRHGQGTYTWTNGNCYTGAWVEGERTGQGTFRFYDGYTYVGNWLVNNREGYGEMVGPNGYSYKGQWKADNKHGTGTEVYAGGDTYTGDFLNGQRHGQGTYTWNDGSCYVGDWVDGQRTGKGTITWTDGSYYIGDFQDGQMHGKGEYYYAQYGTRYVGDFVGNKRHGWGTYYYADGTTYTGRWENDVRVD